MGAAGNDIISTPHMDDLAARGVMFENSFVTTPICGASRARFLTGLSRRIRQGDFRNPPFRA
ncbi:MAG: sulfatase-like hydrolase/transferase, partial [Acidimicrobiaceae bacterium]|nr:sulfatase-like hydrolase/transferase [Acidimicrobiaceae bacterium]